MIASLTGKVVTTSNLPSVKLILLIDLHENLLYKNKFTSYFNNSQSNFHRKWLVVNISSSYNHNIVATGYYSGYPHVIPELIKYLGFTLFMFYGIHSMLFCFTTHAIV